MNLLLQSLDIKKHNINKILRRAQYFTTRTFIENTEKIT